MVLRLRLVIMLTVALAISIILNYLVQEVVVYPKFLKLEQNYATEDMLRCTGAIEAEVQHLRQFTNDWAAWDDTYDFIATGDQAYIAANFVPETFLESRINVMYACRLDGTVAFGKVMDLERRSFITLPGLPVDRLPEGSPLLLSPQDLTGKGGVMLIDGRPLLVAVQPILTSGLQGPSRGMLIFGKFLNEQFLEKLREQVRVDLAVHTIVEARQDPTLQPALGAPGSPPYLHQVESDSHRLVSSVLAGIDGQPALLLSATIPREISAEGRTANSQALITAAFASLCVVMMLIFAIDMLITRRVNQLHQDVTQIGLGGKLSDRLPLHGRDELGDLANQINSMLMSLERTEQARLISEKQAAELDTLRSTTATYAHEINNPLTVILGLAQIILAEELALQDCKELLGDIMDAAVRIRDVIQKMEKLTEVRFKPYLGNTEMLDLDHDTSLPE